MSLFVVFKIEFYNDKQCYDMLGVFSDVEQAHYYIKRRLKNKVDSGFKRDPVLTKEKYFTIVAKRGSFVTKCPGYCIEMVELDKHYK